MDHILHQLQPWLQQQDASTHSDQGLPASSNSPYHRCMQLEELLKLLQQYPGGLTEAAALTQLQTNIKKQVEACKQQQQPAAARRLPGALPLLACSASHAAAEDVLVAATISGIDASAGLPVLQLVDDSSSSAGSSRAVGMFVHSQLAWLLEGDHPLLAANRSIRAVTTLRRHLGCARVPPLLPSSALALSVAPRQWPGLLGQLPGSSQLYQLGDVLAGGAAALGQEQRCRLNGWLLARVGSIGPVQCGHAAGGGACSRTWSTCSINLLDCSSGSSSSSSEAVSMRWLLLDDAVRYSRLLQPGEQLAMYCPTVKCHVEQQQQQPDPQLMLECADSVVLLVQATDGSCSDVAAAAATDGAPGATEHHTSCTSKQQQQQQQQQQCASWYDLPTGLSAGQREVVLCGVVSGLQRLPSKPGSGAVLACRLADSPTLAAAGSCVQLQLQFLPHSTSKVLQQLRDGHTLLVTRASCQQQPGDSSLLVVWREGPGSCGPLSAAAQDLSCLPALLSTSCIQQLVDVRQLQQQQRGPLLVQVVITAANGLATCHVHRACGRRVQPAAVDVAMLGSQQGDDAAEQAEPEACELWCCSFCGAECSSAEVELSCCGSVQARAAQDAAAAAAGSIQLQVDQHAFTSLMQATPGMDMQQQPERSVKLLEEVLKDRIVVAAVYPRPADQDAGGASQQQQQQPQWCVSQWKLL
uniref:Cell division control protein 24 OB domain-containing protein n=1 Tax=Tetradesmus obliquus TaxID=3088 RepID=A0A383WLU1_TETOB|eukprot:jgi/Sobl393_1/12361/SZX78223.1